MVNKEKKIKANVAETEQARGITWYKEQTIRTLSNVYNLFGFKSKYTGKSFKDIKWGYDNNILKNMKRLSSICRRDCGGTVMEAGTFELTWQEIMVTKSLAVAWKIVS